jgi:hypothetical protein
LGPDPNGGAHAAWAGDTPSPYPRWQTARQRLPGRPMSDESTSPANKWDGALAMWVDATRDSAPPNGMNEGQLAARSFNVANAALKRLGFAPELGTMSEPVTPAPAEDATDTPWRPDPGSVASFASVALQRFGGNRHAAIEYWRGEQSRRMYRELTFGDAVIDYLGRGEHKHSPTETSDRPEPPHVA